MARKSVTVKAAWITFSAVIIAAIISFIAIIWSSSRKNTDAQSIGDIKNNSITVTGDDSPVTINVQNIQQVAPTVIFTNHIESQIIVTNVVYKEVVRNEISEKALEDIHQFEKTHGLDIKIPTNHIGSIKTPSFC